MAYLEFYKRSYSKGERPTRKIRANCTDWPVTDRRKSLRSLALDWGSINWQQTVFSSDKMTAINFGCSGHGGVLLFSLEKLDWVEKFSTKQDYYAWPAAFPHFYVYEFEEDCGWAVFYLALSDKLKMKFVKQWGGEMTIEKLDEYAERSRNEYFPDTKFKLPC